MRLFLFRFGSYLWRSLLKIGNRWSTIAPPCRSSLVHIRDAHTEFVGCSWSLYNEGLLASCAWDSRVILMRIWFSVFFCMIHLWKLAWRRFLPTWCSNGGAKNYHHWKRGYGTTHHCASYWVGLGCVAQLCTVDCSYLVNISSCTSLRVYSSGFFEPMQNWTAITRCSLKRSQLENTSSFLRLIAHHWVPQVLHLPTRPTHVAQTPLYVSAAFVFQTRTQCQQFLLVFPYLSWYMNVIQYMYDDKGLYRHRMLFAVYILSAFNCLFSIFLYLSSLLSYSTLPLPYRSMFPGRLI